MIPKTPKQKTLMTKTEMTEKEALLRLSALCSQSERCTWELDEKMRRWGMDADARQRVLGRLKELRFVDDERYARAFVRDKIRYNKWGRRKVEQALWAKRIGEDVRQKVLDEVADADYLAVLRPLLKSRARAIGGADSRERTRRLVRFALGRGFGYGLVRQCIDVPDDICGDDC